MIVQNRIRTLIITAIIAVIAAGASLAQQPASMEIRQLVPPDSLLVIGFDGRPSNPSIQAITKAEGPAAKELRLAQEIALKKSVEDFATLFGISLDFAKEIDSWADQQWAIVLLADDANEPQPVFMIASTDPAAAQAVLNKTLAPWKMLGSLTTEPDTDFLITSFKATDKSIEAYASASGPVFAVSSSKVALKTALKGGGFAAESAGSKALDALSGSMFYAYAAPDLLDRFGETFKNVPISGIATGLSVADNGITVRTLGYPNKTATAILKQFLEGQPTAARAANPAIPATSLVAASFPELKNISALGTLLGTSEDSPAAPFFDTIATLSDTQLSAAITTLLPKVGGVASAVATSDKDAKEKLAQIIASLEKSGLTAKKDGAVTIFDTPFEMKLHLTQQGSYVLAASDAQSLATAVATIKGERPALADSATYKEVMAALGTSNLQTVYVNLAPIRSAGYLMEGTGLTQWAPIYASLAKSIQSIESLGLGAGYDGDAVSVTAFLRAKPGITTGLSPASVTTTAVSAALFYPAVAQFCQGVRQGYLESRCNSDINELYSAMYSYVEETGRLPKSATWKTEIQDYYEGRWDCPTGKAIYAFNKNLSGVEANKIKNESELIVLFEAAPGLANAAGSRADAILPHEGQGHFVYADGHSEYLSEVPARSQWIPKLATPKNTRKTPAKKTPSPKKVRKQEATQANVLTRR